MSVDTLERPSFSDAWSGKPLQVVGAGANTAHFGGALKNVQRDRPVEVFEMRDVDPSLVPHDVLYNLSEESGKLAAERALGEQAIAAYISLIPSLHVSEMERHLRRVARGVLGFVVVAKPAVQTIEEMRAIDTILEEVQTERRALFGDEADALPAPLWVHEHYDVKDAWEAVRDQLPQMMDVLGRLEKASVTIQEARTVESEGREKAFEGGALEDLGPHVISIGLGVEKAFGRNERYSSSNKSSLSLERYRYEDSVLPDGVETGFIIKGSTTIVDHMADDASYELPFVWQGGKGLEDKKTIEFSFVHPDTGERSTVVVDLQRNTIEAPEAVAHLFPQTEFTDNGYGEVVERGLNGEDPAGSFQDWETARKVIKIGAFARRLSGEAPIFYTRNGQSLDDLSAASTAV